MEFAAGSESALNVVINVEGVSDEESDDPSAIYPDPEFLQDCSCCCNFLSYHLLLRKLMFFGVFLAAGCGIQLLVVGLEEMMELDATFGSGFVLAESYYKALAVLFFLLAALFSALGTYYRSLRLLVTFIALMVTNLLLIGACEVLVQSYAAQRTILGFLDTYITSYDFRLSQARKGVLNHVQHEFNCCGGEDGIGDFKGTQVLPLSCCYHPVRGTNCDKTMAHLIHEFPCAPVISDYLHSMLMPTLISAGSCGIVAGFLVLIGTLYTHQVWRKKKKEEQDARSDEEHGQRSNAQDPELRADPESETEPQAEGELLKTNKALKPQVALPETEEAQLT